MTRGLSPTPINDVAAYAAFLGAEVNVAGSVVTVRCASWAEVRRVEERLSREAARDRWPRGAFAVRLCV